MGYIAGLCLDFCPSDERERAVPRRGKLTRDQSDRRGHGRVLHSLELFKPGQCRCERPDPLCVPLKEYTRTEDDKPSHVRPPSVLVQAMQHITHCVIGRVTHLNKTTGRDGVSFEYLYTFVSDRIRAIKKDLVVQGLCGTDGWSSKEKGAAVSVRPVDMITAGRLLQQIVRFCVAAGDILGDVITPEFDPHLNSRMIVDCIVALENIYRQLMDQGVGEAAELVSTRNVFLAYSLLTNLSVGPSVAARNVCFNSKNKSLPVVKLALEAYSWFQQKNWVRFLDLVQTSCISDSASYDPVVACILSQYRIGMHLEALRRMNIAFMKKYYPCSWFVSTLHLESPVQAYFLSELIGLPVKYEQSQPGVDLTKPFEWLQKNHKLGAGVAEVESKLELNALKVQLKATRDSTVDQRQLKLYLQHFRTSHIADLLSANQRKVQLSEEKHSEVALEGPVTLAGILTSFVNAVDAKHKCN